MPGPIEPKPKPAPPERPHRPEGGGFRISSSVQKASTDTIQSAMAGGGSRVIGPSTTVGMTPAQSYGKVSAPITSKTFQQPGGKEATKPYSVIYPYATSVYKPGEDFVGGRRSETPELEAAKGGFAQELGKTGFADPSSVLGKIKTPEDLGMAQALMQDWSSKKEGIEMKAGDYAEALEMMKRATTDSQQRLTSAEEIAREGLDRSQAAWAKGAEMTDEFMQNSYTRMSEVSGELDKIYDELMEATKTSWEDLGISQDSSIKPPNVSFTGDLTEYDNKMAVAKSHDLDNAVQATIGAMKEQESQVLRRYGRGSAEYRQFKADKDAALRSTQTGIIAAYAQLDMKMNLAHDEIRFRRDELKAKMKGHMLEVWLFRHDLTAVLKAQYRTLLNATKYMMISMKAFVILMIPLIFVMIQIQSRYGYEPLEPSQSTILKITYADPISLESMDARLEVPDAVVVETPPLRIPEVGEIDFRISASEPGLHTLVVKVGEGQTSKTLYVGEVGKAISPERSRGWFQRLLHPAETGIETDKLSSIVVVYPQKTLSFWGMSLHWIWPFLFISIAAGFAFKYVFGVEL